MAAAVAASLVAFLCSGVFDYLLGVPRLAALFYIIVFCRVDDAAAAARASDVCDQPGSISVPIRSAGQIRLTGALVSASKDGLLPSGKSTM